METKKQKTLNWGKLADNKWFLQTVYNEIFVDDVYQKFFKVEEGDVVMDMGASIGPFSWKIVDSKPSKIYCVEPHPDLYMTLASNLYDLGVPVVPINKALGPSDGKNNIYGLFNPNGQSHHDGTGGVKLDTISFKTLIESEGIDKIDFLKIDIEGEEYNVFNEENFDWITKNVKKIAGEFHTNTLEEKAKWIKFRNQYLAHFDNYQLISMDNVDIKWDVWNDHFMTHYVAFMVYIDNRVPSKTNIEPPVLIPEITREIIVTEEPAPTTPDPVIAEEPVVTQEPIVTKSFEDPKKKWQHWPAPTLEITTIIPEKGCVVDCAFCPQRVLEDVYKDTRILTLENFKHLLTKVPKDVRITFAGFTEPWMNKYATDMVIHAHEMGHPVSVFTTGIGMSVEDMERLVDIPYHGQPNGGFTLHLPDMELLARHPLTPSYMKLLEWFQHNNHRIQNFSTMCMGEVHVDITPYFYWAPTPKMWSRSGNLVREALLKPKLINLKDRWDAVYHPDENRTCGCIEHLYHNVMLPNGDVSLCCMDYGLEQILGNLYEKSYEAIIPNAMQTFKLCNYCENGVNPVEKPITLYK